jgi:hypothetical protein
VTAAEGFGKARLFEMMDDLEQKTRPLMEAARARLAREKGEGALLPHNISFALAGACVRVCARARVCVGWASWQYWQSLTVCFASASVSVRAQSSAARTSHTLTRVVRGVAGDTTRATDPYFPFEDAVDVWGRTFAALGINYQGSVMTLDLCDRPGKYSNGFCHWPQVRLQAVCARASCGRGRCRVCCCARVHAGVLWKRSATTVAARMRRRLARQPCWALLAAQQGGAHARLATRACTPPHLRPLTPTQPAWRHPDGSWQPAFANFTSLATPSQLGSGKTALETLLRECACVFAAACACLACSRVSRGCVARDACGHRMCACSRGQG